MVLLELSRDQLFNIYPLFGKNEQSCSWCHPSVAEDLFTDKQRNINKPRANLPPLSFSEPPVLLKYDIITLSVDLYPLYHFFLDSFSTLTQIVLFSRTIQLSASLIFIYYFPSKTIPLFKVSIEGLISFRFLHFEVMLVFAVWQFTPSPLPPPPHRQSYVSIP